MRDVREAVGDDLTLDVDANSKYTEFEARTILSKIADYRVDFIKDPCWSAELARMAMLAQALSIAILSDLHCDSLTAVQAHLSARAVGGISVKLRRTGITESSEDHRALRGGRHPDGDRNRFGIAHRRDAARPPAHGHPRASQNAQIETHFFEKLSGDVFAGDFGFNGRRHNADLCTHL